ncbi:MAG: cobalt-precorrin 5A hydrolase [Lachnospiraceae bacterium]|nr:cobalt-precorrin 5A hydrolase [Lachnospiraceae bacterium]MBR1524425.1 cobalt-precorrin 5A hydrolase [Lachnospiraceae bacterium]
METAIITFTDKGRELSEKLMEKVSLFKDARTYHAHGKKDTESLHKFIKENFIKDGALIFIGAAGIAVRLIAPYVKDKMTDPAVLVVDELGKFVIPILSGHIGGANEISAKISTVINAIPIITTATDINDKFAVDIYAKENGLELPDRADIVEISSRVLEGGEVKIRNNPEEDSVCITIEDAMIRLKRKPYVLGIGCKKGIRCSQLEGYINEILNDYRLSINDIGLIATIDIKKDEKGLLEWCEAHKKKLLTFTPAELMRQEGDFSRSDFVRQNTGADNVCERAVVAAGCRLFAKKMTKSGITVAIGIREPAR